MDDLPHLTRSRWQFLSAMKRHPSLLRRAFLPRELIITDRGNHLRPASGSTLASMEKAGWVTRTKWGEPGTGMPFQSGGPISAWEVTDAGRKAIEMCPDTFPGEPVYGGKK
jgi:hypothetical protein